MSRYDFSKTFDDAPRKPYLGRVPSDEVVRTATRKYITADFVKNGKKYSPSDYERVRQYITETSPLNNTAR